MQKTVFLGEVNLHYRKAKKPQEQNIRSSRDAYKVFRDLMGERIHHQEMMCCMYLNRANNVMWAEVINIGTATASQVDAQAILKRALIGGCQAIIIAHNHPSGANRPSENDRRATKKLKKQVDLLDIQLHDHLIVCDKDYYSFSDNGDSSLY